MVDCTLLLGVVLLECVEDVDRSAIGKFALLVILMSLLVELLCNVLSCK